MKNNELLSGDVFSNEQIEMYENANRVIADSQKASEGLVERIAGQIAYVAKRKLYEVGGYKNIHAWAMEMHDISKGTVSDAVNTFNRFGNPETGLLLPEYSDFAFSTLIRMKGLSDEDITKAGIVSTMSRSQVVSAIKSLSEIKSIESKNLEDLKIEASLAIEKVLGYGGNDWQEHLKALNEYVAKNYEGKGITTTVYGVLDGLRTAEQCEATIEACQTLYPELFESEKEQEEESSAVEQQAEFISEIVEEHSLESSEESEEEEESSAVEQPEKIESMPVETIDLQLFINADGKIDKKKFLAEVWNKVQGVFTHDFDLTITNCEMPEI